MVAQDILNITTDMDNSAWLLKYVFNISKLVFYTSVLKEYSGMATEPLMF